MSAVTASAPAAPPATAFARSWRVVRLITANPMTAIVWPIAILGIIFAMNLTIWLLIFMNMDAAATADSSDGIRFNGAVTFIYVYMLIVAVQTVNLTFPLALGYGSTRRSFSLGSALSFVLLSVLFSVLLTLGSWIEQATNGWGLAGSFFRTVYFTTDAGWLAQWWIYFCWFVFFFFTGMIFAAVFVRWKAVGLTGAFMALGLLILGVLAWLILTNGWVAFGEVFVTLGTLGTASAALIPGVIAALVSHLVLRRATPRG